MKGQKKIPERMCLGCRTVHPKKDMIRVVRSPENVYSVDMTGKSPGRGAYMEMKVGCLDMAYKATRLERALKHKVSQEIYESVKEQISHE